MALKQTNTILARLFHARSAIILFLFALLSACTITKNTVEPKPSINQIDKWYFEGKIGLRQQQRAQSAFIKWRQELSDFNIELHGPFGKGRTTIEKRGKLVKLRDAKQELHAETPEELFFKASGMSMPVSWLQFWLLGKPAPEAQLLNPIKDEFGRLSQFKQGNWEVTYSKFKVVDGYSLPAKLRVTNTDYQLSLAIKSWQIGDPLTP